MAERVEFPAALGQCRRQRRGTRKAFTGCFSPLSGTFPSNPSALFLKYKKPPDGDFSTWRSGWDSRRHWGSVTASPGNSKSIHRMLFAPLGDVPFESLRSFFEI